MKNILGKEMLLLLLQTFQFINNKWKQFGFTEAVLEYLFNSSFALNYGGSIVKIIHIISEISFWTKILQFMVSLNWSNTASEHIIILLL